MILLKINQLHEKFQTELDDIKCTINRDDCEVFRFAKNHTNEIIKIGTEQIWNELELHFEQIN